MNETTMTSANVAARAARFESDMDTIHGVIYVLDVMANESTEESATLRMLARVLDGVYCDLDELTAGETEAE